MIIYKPFKERKDNISILITEVGYTLSTLLVPFLTNKNYQELLSDIFIFMLLGTTAINTCISVLSLISTVLKRCKERSNSSNPEGLDDGTQLANILNEN